MIAGAEGVNFWKLAKQAAAVSIQPHGGDLWFGDAPFVHLTGGKIDTLTTVRGSTLTDGGVAGRRPSYTEPAGTWDGTGNALVGAANVASGASAWTHLIDSDLPNAALVFLSDYGPSTARSGLLNDVAGVQGGTYELQAGPIVNEMATTTTLPDGRHVRCNTVDNAQGTAATRKCYRDGTDVGNGRAASADMTGKTLGAGNWGLGCRAFNVDFFAAMTASAGGICLAEMSAAEVAAYTNSIRILRNL